MVEGHAVRVPGEGDPGLVGKDVGALRARGLSSSAGFCTAHAHTPAALSGRPWVGDRPLSSTCTKTHLWSRLLRLGLRALCPSPTPLLAPLGSSGGFCPISIALGSSPTHPSRLSHCPTTHQPGSLFFTKGKKKQFLDIVNVQQLLLKKLIFGN